MPPVHNMIPIIAEKTGADPEAIKKQVSIKASPAASFSAELKLITFYR